MLLAGVTALVLSYAAPGAGSGGLFQGLEFGAKGYYTGSGDIMPKTPRLPVFLFGAVVGLFALVGDAVKSYFKRRLGKEGGAPWVPFDQLDFVVFGLLGMLVASPLLPPGWVWHALFDDWRTLATILVLTPLLHLLVNRIGYWLRLKSVPW
jgi:CDP-2,3-bis-(O-geranylgeranyl)-sn-glycerol synthase